MRAAALPWESDGNQAVLGGGLLTRRASVLGNENTPPLADTLACMAWFNSLTAAERGLWLAVAGSAVPADAWAAFNALLPAEDSP